MSGWWTDQREGEKGANGGSDRPSKKHEPLACRDLAADNFFFQAEDGIRDRTVTGVQTCALPICSAAPKQASGGGKTSFKLAVSIYAGWMPWYYANEEGVLKKWADKYGVDVTVQYMDYLASRSEERRVGKECRYRLEG